MTRAESGTVKGVFDNAIAKLVTAYVINGERGFECRPAEIHFAAGKQTAHAGEKIISLMQTELDPVALRLAIRVLGTLGRIKR